MDIYERLAERLDHYAVGFPRTGSGIELRILKRLFAPQEAELYLQLTLTLETPEGIAQRIERPLEEVDRLLESMYQKGLVFKKTKGDKREYGALPFMVGFYEFQLKDMDRELAEMVEAYFQEAFLKKASEVYPQFRTVPVRRAVEARQVIMPYDDLKAILENKDKIAVARCICRVQKGLIGKACDKPLEVCFSFGSHADYYVGKGMARYVDKEEAISILNRCEEVGLVPQPYNAQNPGGLCNCCGDCCGILLALKSHPRPGEVVISNYWARCNKNLCIGCETCLDRCQMDAIRIEDRIALVEEDRCIGCGLCVTTCASGAMELTAKPIDHRKIPPATARETMLRIAQSRGKG